MCDVSVDNVGYHHGPCFSSSFNFLYGPPPTSTRGNQYFHVTSVIQTHKRRFQQVSFCMVDWTNSMGVFDLKGKGNILQVIRETECVLLRFESKHQIK